MRRHRPDPPGFDVPAFLEACWQRRPALLRGALPETVPVVASEDLAALACHDDAESRIVRAGATDREWSVLHGPFEAATLAALPEAGWSLLVHAVDRWFPAVGALLERFRFVPNWRLDDVMASVAPPGGSVGPHVDEYDVFLVQSEGRRRWSWTEGPCDDALVPGIDLAILERYAPDRDEVVEPGDVLYLPPGVGHHGVAIDRSVTLSVGFRAPSVADLLAGWLSAAAVGPEATARYADPGLGLPAHPGEIDGPALDRVLALLHGALSDRDRIADWFGAWVTSSTRVPPEPPASVPTAAELRSALGDGRALRRASPTLLAFARRGDGGATLFHAGERTDVPAALLGLVETVTGLDALDRSTLGDWLGRDDAARVLLDLIASGALAVDVD